MIRRIARRGLKLVVTAGLRSRMRLRAAIQGEAIPAPSYHDASTLRFLAVGRQGYGNLRTERIAASMERTAAEAPTHGVLYLGDNFYPKGVRSIDDRQWRYKFEYLYAGKRLRGMPFFAVAGNHDAEGSVDAEVEYARRKVGSGRWQMDGAAYTRDFGTLARVVFLDTNKLYRDPTEQLDYLSGAFAPGTAARWRIVVGHYGFRSLTNEDYTRKRTFTHLIPQLQALGVDLYVSANDRFQQVIDRPGEPLHFSPNGGGDMAELGVKAENPDTDFARSQGGFGVVVLDERELRVELRDVQGQLTHQRRRQR